MPQLHSQKKRKLCLAKNKFGEDSFQYPATKYQSVRDYLVNELILRIWQNLPFRNNLNELQQTIIRDVNSLKLKTVLSMVISSK